MSLTFTAGDGPYVSSIYTYGAGVSCPVTGTFNVDTGAFVGTMRVIARQEIDADNDFNEKRGNQ